MLSTGIWIIIVIQIILFFLGVLTHAGLMPFGKAHTQAMRAETVIAVVLLFGLIAAIVQKPWSRKAVLGTQIFALLGTLVGLVMIIIGVGPQTEFDLVLHAGMIFSFIVGLWILYRK